MAITDEKDGALATAAVAAAAGAAAYGLKKALEGSGGGSSLLPRGRDGGGDDEDGEGSRGGSMLQTVWDSASDTLLPHAEDAAEAAGRWVAENAPDVIRERLLPRFIEAFNDAA